jgi:signal transduction histidine kinase/DNA-binding response OmpR family regulator
MNHQETSRIDRITEAVHHLLRGKIPGPIPCEDDPCDEIRQLSEKINELRDNFKEIKSFIVPLSEGNLKVEPPPKRNILASPFKQLYASLSHLTWQTQQIAKGDFNQQVDFMGDFSQAFNSMVESLKEARSQLVSEMEQFKRLAEVKNHYLNVMAHDIRTPIGAVLGFADILLDGNLSEEAGKHVQVIKRNCESLLGLINNILDMAKLEKGKMELASVPFSLRTLGEDIAAMIQPKLQPGVSFVFDADEEIPEKLMGDSFRLQQILVNLVGNAAKFTDKGDVRLTVRIQERESDCFKLRFYVRDTGIGIPQNKLEKIFAPFSQADADTAARFGGTGLGLAIAHELVSLMGDKLQVKSTAGKGTTFYFSLSLRIAEKSETEKSIPVGPFSDRCNILVVDDDPQALKIIESILKKYRVRFMLCQDSTKAYDLLIAAYKEKNPFTLAWIDIDMPKLNGLQLSEKIRQDRRLKKVRLIACSSYTAKISEADRPSHFSFVATKPVSPQALQRILEEAASADSETEDTACDLFGIRLLIVDDNVLNRFIITNMMERLNIAVTEAETGLEGVNKVSEGGFDVVLMDKMMPVMNGLEAVRRIREIYDKNTLPILAFTADDSAEDRESFLSAGVNGFVPKPIGYEKIVDTLCEVVNTKARKSEHENMKDTKI